MKILKVGITGAVGFIGTHLTNFLKNSEKIEVVPFEDEYFKDISKLKDFISKCDVLIHLAAMNRGDENEIYAVNVDLVKTLVNTLTETGARPFILFASSTQIDFDNPYGRSKKEGGEIFKKWALENNAKLAILIIPNVFGEGCQPFYNSVVATFCYQLTHNEEPKILVDKEVELIYVKDLVSQIDRIINTNIEGIKEIRLQGDKKIYVSEILSILKDFGKYYHSKKIIPDIGDGFNKNLFNVFLSYVDYEKLNDLPLVNKDDRGELFEIIKLAGSGQIFFSTTKPGVIRGNHYHTRKIERFSVLKGEAIVRLRKIGAEKIIEFKITKDKPESIDIPVWHTHNIENISKEQDLLTLFWCNEIFNPDDADTFFEEV
jgi:UDP-2-acetamido-2,6-beta-L-arabino-hexul-4-ose reductase